MVDFLNELPKKFRERYLDTHEKYLKSISDIAVYLYFNSYNDWDGACETIVNKLLSAGKFTDVKVDNEYESIYFRNLRNAWYHEVALNNPEDNFDQRLKFAPWKIIQCYYSIFAGISALVRCFNSSNERSHGKIISFFGNNFLRNRKRRLFFLPPFNFHLNQQGKFNPVFEEAVNWDYGKFHYPILKDCLKSVYKNGKFTTIPHYLKSLREWVQYEDSYLFFRLYGDSVKRNLDSSLTIINFGYLVHVEFFLIKLFGWDSLEPQFITFINEIIQNLDIEPTHLIKRFNIYEKYLSK